MGIKTPVVLAAGEGKRLRPLTFTRRTCNDTARRQANTPARASRTSSKRGVSEAHIVVKYQEQMVRDYFSQNGVGMKLNFINPGHEIRHSGRIRGSRARCQGHVFRVAGDIINRGVCAQKGLLPSTRAGKLK